MNFPAGGEPHADPPAAIRRSNRVACVVGSLFSSTERVVGTGTGFLATAKEPAMDPARRSRHTEHEALTLPGHENVRSSHELTASEKISGESQ